MVWRAPLVFSRTAKIVALVIVFLVLVGATYQGVATALERRAFPRPGDLIDIGDRQLHLWCTGDGRPTVVLDAAAGSMSSAWAWVQPDVAKTTRVCSYDRSGLGWSEAGEGEYAPLRAPDDLYSLLQRSGETGPFILVGDDLGASVARLFAARHRNLVAALVLIDDPMAIGEAPAQPPLMPAAWPWLARAGILRATGRLSARALSLPTEGGGAMRAFLNRPDHLTRAAQEISRMGELRAAAGVEPIDPTIEITMLPMEPRDQPALLATREESAPVIQAVAQAIEGMRTPPEPEPGHTP